MGDMTLVISVIALFVSVVALTVALSSGPRRATGPQANVLSAPTPWAASSETPVSADVPAPGAAASQAAILDLLARGQKIPAIKLYRQQTGAGLKEAKDAVEAMERRGPQA